MRGFWPPGLSILGHARRPRLGSSALPSQACSLSLFSPNPDITTSHLPSVMQILCSQPPDSLLPETQTSKGRAPVRTCLLSLPGNLTCRAGGTLPPPLLTESKGPQGLTGSLAILEWSLLTEGLGFPGHHCPLQAIGTSTCSPRTGLEQTKHGEPQAPVLRL